MAVITSAKGAQYVEILRPGRKDTSKNQEVTSIICLLSYIVFYANIYDSNYSNVSDRRLSTHKYLFIVSIV